MTMASTGASRSAARPRFRHSAAVSVDILDNSSPGQGSDEGLGLG